MEYGVSGNVLYLDAARTRLRGEAILSSVETIPVPEQEYGVLNFLEAKAKRDGIEYIPLDAFPVTPQLAIEQANPVQAPAVYKPAELQRAKKITYVNCLPCDDNNSLFFPTQSGRESTKERDIRESSAKEICDDCKYSVKCLEKAIERKEDWGIWGGHIFDGRKIMRDRPKVGRPPKKSKAQ